MSAYFVPPAFDCLTVLNNEASRNGLTFSYIHTGDPTNATDYGTMITWTDTDNIQPTWAYLIDQGYNNFVADYGLQIPTLLEVGLPLNDLDSRITALAPVAFSGAYSDLGGKPSIPAAQVQSDWTASSGVTAILNKPALAQVKVYEGTTLRTGDILVVKSATVSSGVAVFNLTTDGTSTGTTIFPNGVIQDSLQLIVNDATAAYQMSWAFTNSNKTITVTSNKLTTANILTGILGQGQANASVVKLTIWGY